MSCGQPPRHSSCWCRQCNRSRQAGACPTLPCQPGSHGKGSWGLVTSPGHRLCPPAPHTPADTPAPRMGMDPGDLHSPRAELALAGVWRMLLVLGDCLCPAWVLLYAQLSPGIILVSVTCWGAAWSCWGRQEGKGRRGIGGMGVQRHGQMEKEALSAAKSCKSPPCRLAGAAWQGRSQCRCQGPGSTLLRSPLAPGERAQGWWPLPHGPLHPPPATPRAAPAHPTASVVPRPRSRTGTLQGHSLCGLSQSSWGEGSG